MHVQLIREFGTPDVFESAEIDTPTPGTDQIRVRQVASSVNPVDTKLRSAGPPIAPELPAVLGCDVAGVVEAVGDGVTRFAVGDEICGCAGGVRGRCGAYGETIAVDAALMAFKPDALDWRETAALPLVSITAWKAMVDRTRVMPGDHVLIHGGAGVGHIAVQLAKVQGARVATTISTLHAIFMLTSMLHSVHPQHHGEILAKAGQLAATDKLRPLLDERRFTLDDIAAAHSHLEACAAVGRVVIDIGEEARRL